ncbi:tRNA-dependent lipid II-amino acid ligase [Cutibacterium acnes JCM 18909]|nr:tRNA-dependent lipid II-amino acid ligase [Cutibacterium acnes JCM 18909]
MKLGTRDDLARFHKVYLETAERDGFTGRPLEYFEHMWDVLNAEEEGRMKVFLAEHEGDVVAATTFVTVGEHAWYSYGASTTVKREVRGSNAIQWAMIRTANEAGCAVYDMRGIVAGVGADDPEIGSSSLRLVAVARQWPSRVSGISPSTRSCTRLLTST